MDTVAVNCNSCGAPLEVVTGTNFVTCRHCGVRLAVKRTASSAYTELLENIDRKTDAIIAHLAETARQDAVERIDREWESERVKYLMTEKDGRQREPDSTVALAGAVGIGAVGLFFSLLGLVAGGWSMTVPGLLVIGAGVWIAGGECEKANRYQEAETRYRSRRAAALARPTPLDTVN